MTISVNTPEEFSALMAKPGAVLIDCWAEWCGPCKAFLPTLDQFADENPGVTVVKVNVDENKPLAKALGVRSIPALFLFKDGQQLDAKVGAMTLPQLGQFVAKATV